LEEVGRDQGEPNRIERVKEKNYRDTVSYGEKRERAKDQEIGDTGGVNVEERKAFFATLSSLFSHSFGTFSDRTEIKIIIFNPESHTRRSSFHVSPNQSEVSSRHY